jgi:hypothetical protein
MKLLLDECVTRFLKRDLTEHDVQTVDEAGFTGLSNGALLRAASGSYDALITVDRNLKSQQNIETLDIAVIILVGGGITYRHLKPLMSATKKILKTVRPGEMITVSSKQGVD